MRKPEEMTEMEKIKISRISGQLDNIHNRHNVTMQFENIAIVSLMTERRAVESGLQ